MIFPLLLSFLRLMWILPKMLWQFAGMKRAINKGKRKFKKSLVKNGIPKELAEDLANDYALLNEILNIKGILKVAKTYSWHTGHNIPRLSRDR